MILHKRSPSRHVSEFIFIIYNNLIEKLHSVSFIFFVFPTDRKIYFEKAEDLQNLVTILLVSA